MTDKTIGEAAGLSSAEAAELFSHLLAEEGLIPTTKRIPRRDSDRPLELSHGQLRLWYLEQLRPGTSVYNVPAVVALRAPVDAALIERAAKEIFRRHSVLRCRFPTVDGVPQVVCEAKAETSVHVIDLRALDEEQQAAQLESLIRKQAETPLDLARGPLARFTLLCGSGPDWMLTINMHHIVSDAWSVGLFAREMWMLCQAYSMDRTPELPELPIQYSDFASWQRSQEGAREFEKHTEFWKDRLAGLVPLALPADRPRPQNPKFTGARVSRALDEPLSRSVRDLARRLRVTPFVVLLAGFKTLLMRYTGRSDGAIGTIVSGRGRAELNHLIGFFANTLVLRTDLSGDPAGRELIRRVEETTQKALEHADLPFEVLVRSLRLERHANEMPLFHVAFLYNEDRFTAGKHPGMPVGRQSVHSGYARFDLTAALQDDGDSIRMDLEYSTELFDAARIRRLADHYLHLLSALTDRPDAPLSTLGMFGPEERRFLLSRHGRKTRTPAGESCAIRTFERRVREQGEAIAGVFPESGQSPGEGIRVTYGELNDRANRIGHYLRGLGVGPEARVGMLVERSFDMVAVLLGILKAGGAYVPLDAEAPRRRTRNLLEDSGAEVVVTHRGLLGEGRAQGLRVVALDDEAVGIEAQPCTDLEIEARSENLAYVLYTSGTTGKPKGVEVTHRGLTNLLEAAREEFGCKGGERFLAVSSLTFDIASMEVLLPLVSGGSLVLVPERLRREAEWLRDSIGAYGVTMMQATPLTWRMLLSSGWEGRKGLGMISGGEVLGEDLAAGLLARGERLWNGYGPTENTIYSTFERVGEHPEVTIGRPVAGTSVVVLDSSLEPVPIGVPGQLHLSGEGLARGYHSQPGLTAETFIPDPYGAEPGRRLYATGDLVRLREDGRLEFLGRIDNQVKVRGFRIELEEIEAAINQLPQIRRCAVISRRDDDGNDRLEAYVEVLDDNSPTSAELHDRLGAVLPPYMIPSLFRVVDRLPTTPGAKLDRRALYGLAVPIVQARGRSPRTPTEVALARIWCNLLDLDDLSIDENFFLVGGHSLLAQRLIAEVGRTLGVHLELRTALESPTVASLASRIDRERIAAIESDVPPIRRQWRGEPIPLAASQKHLWLFHRAVPTVGLFNISSTVVFDLWLEPAVIEDCIGTIAQRHHVLRTKLDEADGTPMQRLIGDTVPPVHVADLTGLGEEHRQIEAMKLAFLCKRAPLDLARGLPFQVTLIHVEPEQTMLIATFAHIVADAWSVDIFMQELEVLYRAAVERREAQLPELPVQYGDVVLWQEARAHDLFERQADYWLRKLDGIGPFGLGNRHRDESSAFDVEIAQIRRKVLVSRGAAVANLGARHGTTPFVTLLAAFKVALARLTGCSDVRVATFVANRGREHTEQLIGLFANTLILRSDLPLPSDMPTILERVHHTVMEALAHQDIPFDILSDLLSEANGLERADLARVLFLERPRLPSLTSPDPSGSRDPSWAPFQALAATTFDLIMMVDPGSHALNVELRYKAALFEEAAMENLLDTFCNVFDEWLSEPPAPATSESFLA